MSPLLWRKCHIIQRKKNTHTVPQSLEEVTRKSETWCKNKSFLIVLGQNLHTSFFCFYLFQSFPLMQRGKTSILKLKVTLLWHSYFVKSVSTVSVSLNIISYFIVYSSSFRLNWAHLCSFFIQWRFSELSYFSSSCPQSSVKQLVNFSKISSDVSTVKSEIVTIKSQLMLVVTLVTCHQLIQCLCCVQTCLNWSISSKFSSVAAR